MWLNEDAVANAFANTKHFFGQAWHTGRKVLNTMDRYADIGLRLFGAAAPMLRGRALESGLQVVDAYSKVRRQAAELGQQADETHQRFRAAVPEFF